MSAAIGCVAALRDRAETILAAAWHADGYTSPNLDRYPWLWTSDSAYHAIVWAHLGDRGRAVRELGEIFRWQTASGFVPHMGYQRDPKFHAEFWGRAGASTITQQPVYGHAVAELRRLGVDVPGELVTRAERGVRWLLEHRLRPDGRLTLCHPWETGSDDSPEWDPWCAGGYDRRRWLEHKLALVGTLELDDEGAAVGNAAFDATSPGFDAITAFAAEELGITDHGIVTSAPTAPVVLTDLFASLVDPSLAPALVGLALDDDAFGGRFGPAGVHRSADAFDPMCVWRGPAWPQLTYLLWVAARRAELDAQADELAERLVAGSLRSSFAECWHPDTGEGIGAVPESWATLAVVVAATARSTTPVVRR